MAEPIWFAGRKALVYQTDIAAEATADAGATWTATESTLANSEKVKINAILAALRSAAVLNGANKSWSVGGLKAFFVQTNVTNEATANSDATYGQPEADLLNSMKVKVNGILAAMRKARIIGGRPRYVYINGRRKQWTQTNIVDITIVDADAVYTSGGTAEQGLTTAIKTKINLILTALDNAGITV
jgi:hypothetical protein